jgi:hypothetical protein
MKNQSINAGSVLKLYSIEKIIFLFFATGWTRARKNRLAGQFSGKRVKNNDGFHGKFPGGRVIPGRAFSQVEQFLQQNGF